MKRGKSKVSSLSAARGSASLARTNAVEESVELRLAIAEYNSAVDSLGRLGKVELDRFGYGIQARRDRMDRVAKTKERMEALSARDYYHANPHLKPNAPGQGRAQNGES